MLAGGLAKTYSAAGHVCNTRTVVGECRTGIVRVRRVFVGSRRVDWQTLSSCSVGEHEAGASDAASGRSCSVGPVPAASTDAGP
jgi:hypothetical protein